LWYSILQEEDEENGEITGMNADCSNQDINNEVLQKKKVYM
jgi:hypothetical protein